MRVCTVVGFPNGYNTTASKVYETRNAIENGADEIDMVINIGWLKDKKYAELLSEIKAVRAACAGKILKVIVETCLLTEEEKIKVCGLVGASGAGKTTLLNILGGMDTATSGQLLVDGRDITACNRRQLVEYRRYDIGFVFQFYNLVQNLTTLENVELATQICKDSLDPKTILKKVGLEERMKNFPSQLSGGEQQMLAMGRALMSHPNIILMDEPSMGLSPIFVNEIFDIIQAVSESGTTVLLVEQNAKKALSIADRAYVLETGKITMSGNAKDLLEDEAVKKAYLGE